MTVPEVELGRLLAAWIPNQRWFAGKGRAASVSARVLAPLADAAPPVEIWLADVRYNDESVETYQIPLVFRNEPIESLGHALVGIHDQDGTSVWIYDALHDKEVTGTWVASIRVAGNATEGPLHYVRTSDEDSVPVGTTSLALNGEQSNTSLVFDDSAILKVFRRLEAGYNPDIEIHEALGRFGSKHVAKLLGYVSAQIPGTSEPTSLAMLQEFMTTATDGWSLAKISVRDLMAEADLHADEAGGDFSAEAYRLGVATAEVHVDLTQAFGTEVLTTTALRARANDMRKRLDAALLVVPQLQPVAAGLLATYDALASLEEPVVVQRIHGDLHLGQVLRTALRWVMLDFEGEPSKSIEDRRAADSPMRDVAGMLRSFDYVAHHQLVDVGGTPQTHYRANEWADRNRGAFCSGYSEAGGLDPREHSLLLRAFEADKAVYETVYETRNRPSWVAVPLASLSRLAGAE
jgi:maltokinase